MMRRLRATVLVLALTCLVAPVAEAGGSDDRDDRGSSQGGFSVRDVQGPTAFAFDGFVNVGTVAAPIMAPAAAVGRFVADGRGHLNDGVRTLVVGGAVVGGTTPPTSFLQTFTCSYTVNSNGTGNATCVVMTGHVPSDETFDFVIVERKKEAYFTATTPGATLRGATKLQQ